VKSRAAHIEAGFRADRTLPAEDAELVMTPIVEELDETRRNLFLAPGEYIDSDEAEIVAYAHSVIAAGDSESEKARALFVAVRDDIRYQPYIDLRDPGNYRASGVLAAREGFCIGKAALYVAACRVHGLPARIAFSDVANHLATEKLRRSMGTELFYWHGYAEVHIGGRWRKASPTFNKGLCEKCGVSPLEFDGRDDALLHAFDSAGRAFMSYVKNHGAFVDVPGKFLIAEMERRYPDLVRQFDASRDMEQEAAADRSLMAPRGD
jgi:transglutaminase-like putative cysteine protease